MPAVFLSGELEILRGDLATLLYEKTRDDVEYLFGDSITGIEEREDGVEVGFEQAAPRRFDLVVGADGLHSNLRSLVFGAESAFLHDLGYYVAIFTTENHLNLDHSGRIYSSPGKTVGVTSARDNSEAKALFYFASAPLAYDRRDSAQQRKILADAFSAGGWEIPRLLRSAADAPDFYFDSVSQIRMDGWSRGRAVLVGDAGYCPSPLSGMGTGLALVGAYVLAGELKAAAGEHRSAFARYGEEMRGYVEVCQKQGRDGGKWLVPESRAWIWLRNLNYRMLPYVPWKGLITGLALKAANSIELKSY